MTTEYYRIENNQEIKIERDEIKKGQLIKITRTVNGEIVNEQRIVTLTDPYEHKTVNPFATFNRGWVVQAKIPPSSKVWTVKL